MLQTLRFVLFPWKKCMRTIEELETECHEPRHDGGIGKDVELFDSEGSDILLTNSALGDELVFDLEISPEQQREEEVELDITHIQSIQTLLGTSDPYLLEVTTPSLLPFDQVTDCLYMQLRRLTDRLSGKSVDDIANEMLKNNFNVIKRTVNNNLERSVHRLHHVFLVVLRPKELASVWDGEQEEIIIQTHFREQFITGCDQPQCAAFAKHLPESFVAEASTFRELIVLIAAQMEEAFLQGDESLPPWRAESAVLSKWFSQVTALASRLMHLSHKSCLAGFAR